MTYIPLVIGAVLGAGGIGALLQSRANNRKTNAEADVTLGAGWHELLESMRKDNNELRERLVLVEQREEECRARLSNLEHTARESIAAVEKRVMDLLDEEIAKRG